MEPIVVGLISSLVVVAYLAWRRHVQWQNLFWLGGGWTVFFIVFALSIQAGTYGPILFLSGCISGAMIQRGFDAEKRLSRTQLDTERPAT
jgi:hypothetical protein